MNEVAKTNPWIHSAKVDLIFFAFAWVLLFAGYVIVDQTSLKGQGRMWLLYLTLLFTVFHRHLTFPLVYGDPEIFQARKKIYAALPFFLLLVTTASVLYVRQPTALITPAQPVAMKKGENFMVYFWESNQSHGIPVEFSGQENDLSSLASRLETAVEGKLEVLVEGDGLRLSIPKGSPYDKFSFGVFRGRNLQNRLGLPRESIVGWKVERPLFLILVLASAFWNFWHTLMQKLGILRVYSRKADYGKSWLDRSMVWVWFGALFFALAASADVRRQAVRLAAAGKVMTRLLEPISTYLTVIAWLFFLAAAALTLLYVAQEYKNRDRFHWPKNIFLLSIWGIYLAFFYDFLAGYVTFGFSHAIEYLAFVAIFTQRKYACRPMTSSWMARLVHHGKRNFFLFMSVSALIFVPWFWKSPITLNWYIVATSFMHFLYDGWIWKVRRPEVGTALGIKYQAA